jgi:hypothetical protein
MNNNGRPTIIPAPTSTNLFTAGSSGNNQKLPPAAEDWLIPILVILAVISQGIFLLYLFAAVVFATAG